jgi:hypothetical protein
MAKCFPVASAALWASAIATLKYRKDGAPNLSGPVHRPVGTDGVGSAGTVTWTTQPAGGALSVIHVELQCGAVPCQEHGNSNGPLCPPDGETAEGPFPGQCARPLQQSPFLIELQPRLVEDALYQMG